MCRSKFRELRSDFCAFWHDKEKVEGEGFILPGLRKLFTYLEKFSYIRFKVWRLQRKKHLSNSLYKVVDCYEIKWVIKEIIFFILLAFYHTWVYNVIFWIPFLFILYRLFDIFQAWVSQFVLGGVPKQSWKPINIYRSLVLVFIGYGEITISYAFIAFFRKEQFQGITCWQQALYYSVRNAVTIGTDYNPISIWGYLIFWTQVGFALLFLTAVVNSIITHTEKT